MVNFSNIDFLLMSRKPWLRRRGGWRNGEMRARFRVSRQAEVIELGEREKGR